jgi:hypothetical protein
MYSGQTYLVERLLDILKGSILKTMHCGYDELKLFLERGELDGWD